MFEILFYTNLNCVDTVKMLDRIESNKYLNNIAKAELIEVLQEATPHCPWDAND